MSIKEANRLSIMQQIDKKLLNMRQASEELGISIRQARRLRKRYEIKGVEGLISKRRGSPSPNRTPKEKREKAIRLLKSPMCEGWGPTFAQEKLEASHELCISRETLRNWMIEEGLWKSKTKKEKKIYQRRTRRGQFGELLQGDGSHHNWFEGRGEKCALLIFVDDATSQITSGRFFETETTIGYLEVLEGHLKKYGRPLGLYVDKHSVFRVNKENIKTEAETHFGRVLRELDIKLICAHSPQAKGRVERANGTLQDRLVKEMRLKNISTIEEANLYLPEFIRKYNQKFGKDPKEKKDAHRNLRTTDDLGRIFAKKAKRKLSKDLTFQYGAELYQIETKNPNRIRKTHVEILSNPGEPVIVEIEGKVYSYKKWKDVAIRRTPILDVKEMEKNWTVVKRKKPGRHHPWR